MAATPEQFTLTIEKLSERDKTANILVYGGMGVGKTSFAATAPRGILWLEAEGGTNSIEDPSNIDIVRMSGLESYREALRFLQANPTKYKTVVIDSISEVQAAVMSEIMRGVVAKDDEGKRNEFAPQLGEWGHLTGVMRAIIRSYRDLPVNVVLTALTREDTDERTGMVRVKPGLTPALADDISNFMDAVIYMGTSAGDGEVDGESDVIYNALLKPTGKYAAKVRNPKGKTVAVPKTITDPTFADIASLMGVLEPVKKQAAKPTAKK